MRCCKSKYYPQKSICPKVHLFQGSVCNLKQNHDISAERIITEIMNKSFISSISLLAIIFACYASFPQNEKTILFNSNIEALVLPKGLSFKASLSYEDFA